MSSVPVFAAPLSATLAENKMERIYTPEQYLKAFRAIKIHPHHLRMLQTHYFSPDRTITATQMAKAMGFRNYNASNLHYGACARMVGEKLGWLPDTTLFVLVNFEKPDREWLWIMRSEVAQTIETLGFVGESMSTIPEEILNTTVLFEGALKTITINAYERNPAAREQCILHHGCCCSVCGIMMADKYGEIAQGYVHVHHLRQLSDINGEYQVDPIHDMRPVCPNCHSVIHMKIPPYTVEEVRELIGTNQKDR